MKSFKKSILLDPLILKLKLYTEEISLNKKTTYNNKDARLSNYRGKYIILSHIIELCRHKNIIIASNFTNWLTDNRFLISTHLLFSKFLKVVILHIL